MYSEEACARPTVARTGTQPFATEWAAKNPAVKTSSPTTTAGSHGIRVIASPESMMNEEPSSTARRPTRTAIRPAWADDHVPER